MNQGEILVNQGRLDEAESVLLEARRVLRATGSELGSSPISKLGRLRIEQGDLAEAERLLTHAQQDAAAVGRHGSALEAAIHLSRCHLLRGDPAAPSRRCGPRNGPPRPRPPYTAPRSPRSRR